MNTAEDSKVKHGSYCPVLQRNVLKAGLPVERMRAFKGFTFCLKSDISFYDRLGKTKTKQ